MVKMKYKNGSIMRMDEEPEKEEEAPIGYAMGTGKAEKAEMVWADENEEAHYFRPSNITITVSDEMKEQMKENAEDGFWSRSSDEDIEGALEEADIDADEIVAELEAHKKLTEISGVGERKARVMYDEGYETIEDVQEASQDELSRVPSIGDALAARIKADIGSLPFHENPDFLGKGTLMVNMHE